MACGIRSDQLTADSNSSRESGSPYTIHSQQHAEGIEPLIGNINLAAEDGITLWYLEHYQRRKITDR